MVTLYEILEVSEKASDEIIEKAYKTLAKKYHPDLQPDEAKKKIASEKMKKINEAYSVLSDRDKRKEYDEKLEVDRQKKEASKAQNHIQYNDNHINNNDKQQTQNSYGNNTYYTNEKDNGSINDWRDLLYHLTNDERSKITKKIQRDAKKEYESMYREYFRSMGYKVKRKVTFRGVCSVIIFVCIVIILIWILWKIPVTRQYIIEEYQNDAIFRILIDLVYGIFKGIIQTLKSILKINT